MKNKWLIEVIAALLICLFVYAAMSKLFSYSLFVTQLRMHPLLKPIAGGLAWGVPAIELVLTILLIIPRFRLSGLYGSAGLLIVFTLYLAGMLLTDKHLPCSCGGVIGSLSWGEHIVFNGVFIFLALTGIRLAKPRGFVMTVSGKAENLKGFT